MFRVKKNDRSVRNRHFSIFQKKILNILQNSISNRKKNMKIGPWVFELRFYSVLKCK